MYQPPESELNAKQTLHTAKLEYFIIAAAAMTLIPVLVSIVSSEFMDQEAVTEQFLSLGSTGVYLFMFLSALVAFLPKVIIYAMFLSLFDLHRYRNLWRLIGLTALAILYKHVAYGRPINFLDVVIVASNEIIFAHISLFIMYIINRWFRKQ